MIRWAAGRPAVIWATAVALSGACRSPALVPVPAGAVAWQPFYWAQVESAGVRFPMAAILMEPPPRFRDKGERLLQLDLAASGTMPDGFPRPAGPPADPDSAGAPRQTWLAGLLRGFETIRAAGPGTRLWKEGQPVPEIGTYGLPAFGLGLLMVDMAGQRIGTAPSGALSRTFWEQVPVIAIQAWDDRMLVSLSSNGDSFTALLDTGLSPFALWTSCGRFQELTGLNPAGAPQVGIRHPTGALTFAHGRTRNAVTMGGVSLGRLETACLIDGPAGASVERWGWPVEAMLGATAFDRSTIVVMDLRRQRFTIVPSRRFPAR